jgi:hypothetical protein
MMVKRWIYEDRASKKPLLRGPQIIEECSRPLCCPTHNAPAGRSLKLPEREMGVKRYGVTR